MKTTFKTLLAATLLALATQASAFGFSLPEDIRYGVKFGYNIGGTAPLGIPATIRKMNEYHINANFSVGFDVHVPLKGPWGITTALRLENKGMEVDASVKNYRTSLVRGGNSISGYYTGHTVIRAEQWLLTLPVMATYNVGDKVALRFGPYLSYVSSRSFDGYVYSGHLREGDPTGTRIVMGPDEKTGATFDFTDDMRRWQVGLDIGVDWYFYKRWGVYADLTWGLTGIFKSSFDTVEQTLYPIYGTIGIAYKL